MAIKYNKRCNRCRQILREDGTCQNPKCVRYTPPVVDDKAPEAEKTK